MNVESEGIWYMGGEGGGGGGQDNDGMRTAARRIPTRSPRYLVNNLKSEVIRFICIHIFYESTFFCLPCILEVSQKTGLTSWIRMNSRSSCSHETKP